MANLVSTRTKDTEAGECSGCGKMCYVYYEIKGRWDKEAGHIEEGLFLCYNCFRPFKKIIKEC